MPGAVRPRPAESMVQTLQVKTQSEITFLKISFYSTSSLPLLFCYWNLFFLEANFSLFYLFDNYFPFNWLYITTQKSENHRICYSYYHKINNFLMSFLLSRSSSWFCWLFGFSSSSSVGFVCLFVCVDTTFSIWFQHSDLFSKFRRWLNSSVVLMITRPYPTNSLIESSYYYYSSFLIVCFFVFFPGLFLVLFRWFFLISRFKKRKQNKWFFKREEAVCVCTSENVECVCPASRHTSL